MEAGTKPLVTIVCLAYNHERYISKALDSFLSQKTSFDFQIFVGEDCGTDKTASIVKEYAERFPNTIIPFFRTENIGAQRNMIDLCCRAETPYIAFCEGDDYWIDDQKLQKQFDYMKSDSSLRACFHDTEIAIETNDGSWFLSEDYNNTADGKLRWCTGHKQFIARARYLLEDYIPCGFVHTSSMFIRWDRSVEIPEWFYTHIVGDYPIWMLQVGEGEFGFLNETMSCHRRQNGGSYHFDNRIDFWKRTKADWIYLDQDLIDHFEKLDARKSIVDALKQRRLDDLSKLLRAFFLTEPKSNIKACLEQNSDITALCLNLTATEASQIDLVRKKLGLPKYLVTMPPRMKKTLRSIKRRLAGKQ